MKTKGQNTRSLTRAALIAAIYAVLTLLLYPISCGMIQFRLSEALTLLPILLPEAIPGLAVGCLVANLLGGATIADIVFGSLATLLAASLTRLLRAKPLLAALMPVIVNGTVVGTVLSFVLNTPLLLTMAYVTLGEAGAVAVGMMLIKVLRKLPLK